MRFEGMTWNDHFCCLRYLRFLRYLSVSTFRWSWRPRTCGNSLTHKGPPANMYMIDMIWTVLIWLKVTCPQRCLEICWWLYNIFVWHMPKQCRRYSIPQKSRGFPCSFHWVFTQFWAWCSDDPSDWLSDCIRTTLEPPNITWAWWGNHSVVSSYCLIPWNLPSSYPVGFVRTKGTP